MAPARILLVSLVGIAVVAAGCVAPAGTDGTVEAAALGPTVGVAHGLDGAPLAADLLRDLPASAGVQLDVGMNAVEPTLGVTSDGSIFMSALDAMGAPTVVRSQDRGLTWEDVGPTLPNGWHNPPITNDPYVYVDPATDRVFMIDLYALACSWLSFSDDLGETWTTSPVACGLPPGAHDHQTIVAAPPVAGLAPVGYENLVYYCVNRVADTACAVSLNGGLTFGPLVPIVATLGVDPNYPDAFADATPLCSALMGHLEADSAGRLFVPFTDCSIQESPPMMAVSEDGARTWAVHVVSEDVIAFDHDVDLALDDAGHVYALWQGADGLPHLASSADLGATWTPARNVAPPGVTAVEFPAIHAGESGRLALAYVGTTIEGGYETPRACEPRPTPLLPQRCEDAGTPWEGATWNAYLATITDALGPSPVVTTVSANDPSDPVARGWCGRSRCSGMTDFIDVRIDPEGRPWASFVDVCVDECAKPDGEANSADPVGFAGTLRTGPALRGAPAALPLLPHTASEAAEREA